MKIAAYSLRLGGSRSYENGMIDIGAVVLDGDSFESEYYCLMSPDDNRSYRPGALRFAGVTFDMMYSQGEPSQEACYEFLLWANDRPGVWGFDNAFPEFINASMRGMASPKSSDITAVPTDRSGNPRFARHADIGGLYDVLRAFGVKGPDMGNTRALMEWCGIDPFGYEKLDALSQAKQAALTLRALSQKLGTRLDTTKELTAL